MLPSYDHLKLFLPLGDWQHQTEDGRFLRVGSAAEELLGGSLVGVSLDTRVHPTDRPRFLHFWRSIVQMNLVPSRPVPSPAVPSPSTGTPSSDSSDSSMGVPTASLLFPESACHRPSSTWTVPPFLSPQRQHDLTAHVSQQHQPPPTPEDQRLLDDALPVPTLANCIGEKLDGSLFREIKKALANSQALHEAVQVSTASFPPFPSFLPPLLCFAAASRPLRSHSLPHVRPLSLFSRSPCARKTNA